MRSTSPVVACLVIGLLLSTSGSRAGDIQGETTFSGRTDLVVLHVNVQDARGGWIGGLGKSAFGVFEDGKPQDVSFFVTEDSPVTVGLLVDNSISMREHRDLVVAAAGQFSEASHPDDEVFALVFNEHVSPVLPPEAPFTRDPVTLRRALDVAISARGRTAFFDAVRAGLAYAANGTHQRKVLVVVSDGGDNASEATFEDVLKRTQAANVVVYAVALVDPLDPEANPGRLRELARVTGGAMFTPRSRTAIAEVLTTIASDIRHTYTIGYTPARAPDGKYRSLRVVVTPPAGRRVMVRTRAGYVADQPVSVPFPDGAHGLQPVGASPGVRWSRLVNSPVSAAGGAASSHGDQPR